MKLHESQQSIVKLNDKLNKEIEEKELAYSILEQTKERFDFAVNGSNDGLWDWPDMEIDTQWWSKRVYELFGYSENEITPSRKTFLDIIHPDDRELERKTFKRCVEDKTEYTIELRLKLAEGRYHWFKLKGRVVLGDKGNLRMSGSIQDINEQQDLKKKMNYHIRELELISKNVLMINTLANPQEICHYLKDCIMSVNRDCCLIISLYDKNTGELKVVETQGFDDQIDTIIRILGFDIREFSVRLDIDFAENVIPEVKSRKLTIMKNGIYDLLGRKVEKKVTLLAMNYVKVDTVYHIGWGIFGSASGGITILVKKGQQLNHVNLIETIVNFSSLVIERLFALEDLHQNQQELNLAIQSGNIGMWEWNVKDNTSTYNDQWIEMLGYRAEDFLGQEHVWEDFLHPEDKEKTINKLKQYVLEKEGKYQAEYRLRAKSGNWKWIRAQGEIVEWDEDGEAARVIGSHINIDDLKRSQEKISMLNADLEQRVKERTSELEKLNRELRDFSYSISHDLKSPIRAIGGYVEILKENCEDHSAEVDDLLELIIANARTMGQLVEDLLFYFRLSRLHVERTELDMAVIAWNAYNQITKPEVKKNINLMISEMESAFGNADQIKIVFSQLIENSIKYRKPDQTLQLEIGYMEYEGSNYYFVRDNGIGFNMDYKHHIFKIFHTLNNMEKYEGTGVGLAIVKKIIEMHGGTIFVESAEQVGTTIYFNLGKEDSED